MTSFSGRNRRASVGIPELMIGALAAELRDDDVVGVGLGTVLGLIAILAAQRTHAPGLEFVCAGALSPHLDGILDVMRGPDAMEGRTGAWISHVATMEMAERQAFTTMFLRPAQVDVQGSLNVSRVGGKLLPGGVGAGDTPSLLPRTLCYHTDHSPRSLPERVDFVTSSGAPGQYSAGVVALVTDRCVIGFEGGKAFCRSIHPGQERGAVAAATGYPLPGLVKAPVTAPPPVALLAAIEEIDPLRLRDLEFRATRGAAERRLRVALRHSTIPISHC